MEFIEYLRAIKKRWVFVVVLTVIIALLGMVAANFIAKKYDVSISLAIAREGKQETVDYKYDGYYAIQASEIFSENVESWFYSAEIVKQILDKAEVQMDVRNVNAYQRFFSARKLAAQNVQVKFTASSEEQAQEILMAVDEVVNKRTKILNEASDGAFFTVIMESPIVVDRTPDYAIGVIAGAVVGLIVSIFLVFIFAYLKKQE